MKQIPAEWGHALLLPAEAAINHALRFDPGSQVTLTRLAGQRVQLRLAGRASLFVRLLPDSVNLSLTLAEQQDDDLPAADVTITGTAQDFLALLRADNKASAMLAGNLLVDGDTELAISLGKLADHLAVDWEAMITPLTGGMLAHQLGQGLRNLLGWGQRTRTTVQAASRDYLFDESGLLVHPLEQEATADRIDRIKLATDRLEARVQLLEQRPAAPDSGD